MEKSRIPRVVNFAFTNYMVDAENGKRRAECGTCGKAVLEKNGTTSNFTRHLRTRHPELYKRYQESKSDFSLIVSKQQLAPQESADNSPNFDAEPLDYTTKSSVVEKQKDGTTSSKEATKLKKALLKLKSPTKQSTTFISDEPLTVCVVSDLPPQKKSNGASATFSPSNLDHKKNIRTETLLLDLIINDSLPLNIVESRSFNAFAKRLNRNFKPVSLDAVNSGIQSRCNVICADMRKRLINCQSVNATIDVWNDGKARCFVAVTAHMIEENIQGLKLSSYLLSCERLFGKHCTGEISTAFSRIVEEFNLSLDYVSITDSSIMKNALALSFPQFSEDFLFDGVYFDDKSIWETLDEGTRKSLQVEVHDHARQSSLQCFASHLRAYLHNVLKNAKDICLPVQKVCRFASEAHNNQSFASSLITAFSLDINTITPNTLRWKPTMQNIETFLSCNREKLNELCESSQSHDVILNDDEYTMLIELYDALHLFYEATKLLEKKDCSISVVIPTVLALYKHLVNFMHTTKLLREFVIEVTDSLYQNFKGVFVNVGMSGMTDGDDAKSDCSFDEQVYIQAAVLDPTIGFQWLRDVEGDRSAKKILKKRIIDDIVISAESMMCFEAVTSSDNKEDADDQPSAKKFKLFANYGKKSSNRDNENTISSQLQEYIKMVEFGCGNISCLQFWNKNKSTFNLIYPLARTVLAIPANTTTVAQVMATGGIMTKPRQASTDQSMLPQLVFLKSNHDYKLFNENNKLH